jgi:tape measure domain-containing protein
MDTSEFQRNLRQVERQLGNFGKRMEDVGGQLTTRLTLPLAAVGGAALQAFAQMDKFTKGLGAVMGSTTAAEQELVKLREVAKLPGLGFQEAVQGSTNLQAVGLSADEARSTLQGFGAAIAATGGGAAELGEVQRQLTQIISKNRILQEDYGVLQERVPLIGRALEQAFGTSNIEKVRQMGVSGREFVSAISQALITLPQTQNLTGGLANGFENLSDSTRNALATFGEAINRSLGVEKALNALGDTLNAIADGFASLSPTTQKVIVIFAAFVTAIGPVLFAIGSIAKISAIAAQGLTLLTGTFAKLAANALALNTIGIAIAAISAAVVLFVQEFERYKRSIDGATAATARLAGIQNTAKQNTIAQRTEVNRLVEELNKDNITKKRQAEIIKELNTISPQYFGEVAKSADKYKTAKEAAKLFNDELIRTAKIQAAKDELVEIERQLLKVDEAAKPTILQQLGNAFLSFGNLAVAASRNTNTYASNLSKATDNLKAQRDALIALISTEESKRPQGEDQPNGGGGGGGGGIVDLTPIIREPTIVQYQKLIEGLTKTITKKFGDSRKAVEGFNSTLSAIPDVQSPIEATRAALAEYDRQITLSEAKTRVFGRTAGEDLAEKLSITEQALISAIETFGENSVAVETLVAALQNLKTSQDPVIENQKLIAEYQTVIGAAFNAAAGLIEQSGLTIQNVLRAVGRAVLQAAADFVRGKIVEAIASWAADAFKKFGILGVAVAAAGGAIVGSVFQGIINKVAPPKLARGGVTTGETLAVVGDNPSGKEAIIPFERMGEFLNMAGGGGTRVFGQFEVRGQDLVLVLDRAQQSKSRVR